VIAQPMAYCAHCGKEISPQAIACPQCGHPVVVASGAAPPPDGFAIASLATAISGLTLVPVVGSILGIVFGKIAKDRIARDPSIEGIAMARAGTIIGWVGLVLGILFVVALVAWFELSRARFQLRF